MDEKKKGLNDWKDKYKDDCPMGPDLEGKEMNEKEEKHMSTLQKAMAAAQAVGAIGGSVPQSVQKEQNAATALSCAAAAVMGGVSSENILCLADAASGNPKAEGPKTDGPQLIDGVLTIKNLPVIQEKMPKKAKEEEPPQPTPEEQAELTKKREEEEKEAAKMCEALVPAPTDEMLAAFDEEAQRMAEKTLKNMSDEEQKKKLPVLKAKIKDKLVKAHRAKAVKEMAPKPAAPPEPKGKTLSLVLPGAKNGDNLIAKTMEMMRSKAEEQEAGVGSDRSYAAILGQAIDEYEINDYPELARKRITAREPIEQIEEVSGGAKLIVKGQWFPPNAKVPPGSKKLYVEIVGTTQLQVSKAKSELRRFMETVSIRTLNIPGMKGQARKYTVAGDGQ